MKPRILELHPENEDDFFGLYKDESTYNEPYVILQINQGLGHTDLKEGLKRMKKMRKWLDRTIKFLDKNG